MRYKTTIFYFFASVLPVCIALSGLSDLTPWVDEVMFVDAPMHYVQGKGWTTHSWYSIANQQPFLLYPPLYSMTLVPWMKVFGTGIIACRSLNVAVTLFVGWGLIRILQQLNQRISIIQVLLLIILLWYTSDMVFMYSNGRPDLMGALFLVFIVNEMIRTFKSGKRKWSIFILSAFLITTSIQAAVCLVILLLLSFFVLETYRKDIMHLAFLPVSGIFMGFIMICAFMAYHGHLISFVVNIFSYSGTAKAVTAFILPIMGDCIGIDTGYYLEKLSKMGVESPLYMHLIAAFTRPAYVLLLIADFIFFLVYLKHFKREPCYMIIKYLFVMTAGIPLLMVFAGRFEPYYYWMAYLPLFLLTVLLFKLPNYRWGYFVIAISVLFILTHDRTQKDSNDYHELESFISHCTMLKDKRIIAPFSVFYAISELSCTTYYLGILPPQYLPDEIDCIILPDRSADYGNHHLYDFFEAASQCDSLQWVLVAENKRPELKVYFKNLSVEELRSGVPCRGAKTKCFAKKWPIWRQNRKKSTNFAASKIARRHD